MFYRAAIVKEDKNARSITLREMTKEKVEEMIPRIKSFLYRVLTHNVIITIFHHWNNSYACGREFPCDILK